MRWKFFSLGSLKQISGRIIWIGISLRDGLDLRKVGRFLDPKYENTWRRLDSAGIRSTSQRLEMAHLLLSKPQHLTADEVFGLINSQFPHASRATIFNNLKLFVEKGVIGTLELKSGKMFYDSNLDHHHHALDEATGEIIDIDLDPVLEKQVQENLKEDFLKKTGKQISSPSLVVTLKGKY